MNIEDCKVGMKVECQSDKYRNINKGDKLTISEVDIKEYNNSYIYFEESHSNYRAENFEPINKFEVGEKVIYKSFDSQTIKKREEAVIFGIAPEKDKLKREYAISYIHEGPYGKKKRVNKMVAEHKLLPLKKKDELEIGDKFKVKTATRKTDRINEVLGVFKDKHQNQTKYVAKRVQGDWKGFVDIYNSEMIEEIIYD